MQFPARGSTQVLLCLFPGVLWLWHFLYSVGPRPVSSLHIYIYTFDVSRTFMAGAASQAGDADSSRAPGLTSGLQGSVNVHRGALLLVPQEQKPWNKSWEKSAGAVYITCIHVIPALCHRRNPEHPVNQWTQEHRRFGAELTPATLNFTSFYFVFNTSTCQQTPTLVLTFTTQTGRNSRYRVGLNPTNHQYGFNSF